MILVYILTTIITGCWIIDMVQNKSLLLKKTPLDIFILLFLVSQILSTIFSIDPHTSIWGYYSRQNGGLLSTISYILLFYALVSLFEFKEVLQFLKAAVFGGLIVSLWAIPEHFGWDPSCTIIAGGWNASCWVQDVQARVFATLGQPNWLAAYLEMLIFPAIYFLIQSKKFLSKLFYLFTIICLYLAFTFTYSRGAFLGFLAALVIFIFLSVAPKLALSWRKLTALLIFDAFVSILLGYWRYLYNRTPSLVDYLYFGTILLSLSIFLFMIEWIVLNIKNWKNIYEQKKDIIGYSIVAIIIIVLINLLFGSSLTGSFSLIKQAAVPPRPGIGTGSVSATQLETGGTESGEIRLIVWKGALEIFKHYPLFGSGVETFAYSYYNYRPVEHNYTSEWDFLYNKAHNEYLNYLATTGIFGFLSYMSIIILFVLWSVIRILNIKFWKFKKVKVNQGSQLLLLALLASYISYLIQNFFGFSVVIIALFFFLFPAIAFLSAEELKYYKISPRNFISSMLLSTIFKRQAYTKGIQIVITIFMLLTLFSIGKYWLADTYYAKGQDETDLSALEEAVFLHGNEPLYHSELGFTAAAAAVDEASQDATYSAELKQLADLETQYVLTNHPKNVSLWRTAIRTYYELSTIDPNYEQTTLDAFNQAIKLAPTDPKLYYNKALLYEIMGQNKQAISTLIQAIKLKPNYQDAISTLGDLYLKLGSLNRAKAEYDFILQKLVPNDPHSLQMVKQIEASQAAGLNH